MPVFFEEDDKEFIQFKVGESETYLAVLGSQSQEANFIPAIEVSSIEPVVAELKSRGIKFTSEIMSFTHIRLVEFQDPDGNRVQLFERK